MLLKELCPELRAEVDSIWTHAWEWGSAGSSFRPFCSWPITNCQAKQGEGHWVNPQTESKLRWSELRCTKTLFKEICCEPVKSWPNTLLIKLLTEGCISKPVFGQGETTGTSSYLDCSLMRLITEEQCIFDLSNSHLCFSFKNNYNSFTSTDIQHLCQNRLKWNVSLKCKWWWFGRQLLCTSLIFRVDNRLTWLKTKKRQSDSLLPSRGDRCESQPTYLWTFLLHTTWATLVLWFL